MAKTWPATSCDICATAYHVLFRDSCVSAATADFACMVLLLPWEEVSCGDLPLLVRGLRSDIINATMSDAGLQAAAGKWRMPDAKPQQPRESDAGTQLCRAQERSLQAHLALHVS